MGQNLTRKILAAHRVEGRLDPGEPIAIRMDQVLTHDALGTAVFLQFEAIGIARVAADLVVAYADHNVYQVDHRMTDDQRFIRMAARKFGSYYSRPGTGICHQVHLERFAVPGGTLIGSDSHTPNAGGLGMLAVGAGGLDVAVAMAGGPYVLPMPEVVEVYLTGRLQPWVTAKDVILELLRRLTVKGGIGRVFEYTGPGVATLSVPERATITNMGTELGATSSIFPSDEQTRDYMRRAGREEAWRPLSPDPDAAYDERIELDLSSIEPLVACPSMPDRVRPVRELAEQRVDQVIVGSCTNGSYTDILQVADILRGRRVHPDVDMIIAPSSRQAVELLAAEGRAHDLLVAGAILSEATCGACLGMGHVPAEGSVSLRGFNRNFAGRSGLSNDRVYLGSPVLCAVAAVTGMLLDPRDWAREQGAAAPRVVVPDRFNLHDGDLVPPAPPEQAASIILPRTENISPLPELAPLADAVPGRVLIVVGDDITTDDISPATPDVLALWSNLPAVARYTFRRLDPEFVKRAEQAGGGVVVGGRNYGQGSSREQAALMPRLLGVRVVIARSFARIHRANLINWGIVPLTLADAGAAWAVQVGDDLDLSGLASWLCDVGPVVPGGRSPALPVANRTRGDTLHLCHDLTARELDTVLAGGLLPFTRKQSTA